MTSHHLLDYGLCQYRLSTTNMVPGLEGVLGYFTNQLRMIFNELVIWYIYIYMYKRKHLKQRMRGSLCLSLLFHISLYDPLWALWAKFSVRHLHLRHSQVYDGPTLMAPAFGRHFCGNMSDQVISTGSSISIELRTDAAGSNRGFRAAWQSMYFPAKLYRSIMSFCGFIWNIYPYISGSRHWLWGNHMVGLMPEK